MNRFIKSVALGALVGAFSLFSTTAEAALSMQVTSYNAANVQQATSGVITDGGGSDANPLAGAVTFVGPVGTWTLNVNTGAGEPFFLDQPHLDLNYIVGVGPANGAAVGDYLEITFTQTNTMAPAPTVSTKIGGTNNGTTTLASVLVNGVLTGSLGPFAGAAFSATGSAAVGVATPYTLTQVVRITRTAGGTGNASGDFEIVPEPATTALFGLGLIGLAARARRKLKA